LQVFAWLLFTLRIQSGDWDLMSNESLNPVDMNRLFPTTTGALSSDDLYGENSGGVPCPDPFDRECWENNPNGLDCNGKGGLGMFCYCPSQGFNCSC